MAFELSALPQPLVGAPMAGSSTPALAAAVSNAGGLGFLAAGYKSATAMTEQITETRALTARPFGVNLFTPQHRRSNEAADEITAYGAVLASFAAQVDAQVGEPAFNDDDFAAKIDLLVADPVAVVTFTFGAVPADVVARLRRAGSAVGFTVTDADEARRAEDLGADLLIAQGFEAGGHRGVWSMTAEPNTLTTLEVLERVRRASPLPVIAAGGVNDGAGVRALLKAGADAVAVGTLLVAADESCSPEAHKDALTNGQYADALISRSFSGRYARGLANELMLAGEAHAPAAYPDVHYMTSPIRAAAAKAGNPAMLALWAGSGHRSAVRRPAADIIATLLA